MSKDNHMIKIEINTQHDDESGFEISLDEAIKKIKEGYYSGMDGNEDEDYSFTYKKTTEDE